MWQMLAEALVDAAVSSRPGPFFAWPQSCSGWSPEMSPEELA